VSTTLRRVLALAPTLTVDERKRLLDYLKNSSPNADTVLEALSVK
jgi:ribosomal protein S15P/S13E